MNRSIIEDVETDLVYSTALTTMVMQMDTYIRGQLAHPTYDADKMWVNYTKAHIQAVRFTGSTFGWEGDFAKVLVLLLPDSGSSHLGSFITYPKVSGADLHIITLWLLPYGRDHDGVDVIKRGMEEMVTDKWHGTLLHELKHMQQRLYGQLDRKTSTNTNLLGDEGYYNHPAEFDAHYHQFTRDYYSVLNYLRTKPVVGLEMAKSIGFNRDFKISLNHMLPNTIDNAAWGIWFFAKDRQHRRMVKRLYELHKAILDEILKLERESSTSNTGTRASLGEISNENPLPIDGLVGSASIALANHAKKGVFKGAKLAYKGGKSALTIPNISPTAIKPASKAASIAGDAVATATKYAPYLKGAARIGGRFLGPAAMAWTAYDVGKYLVKGAVPPNTNPRINDPRNMEPSTPSTSITNGAQAQLQEYDLDEGAWDAIKAGASKLKPYAKVAGKLGGVALAMSNVPDAVRAEKWALQNRADTKSGKYLAAEPKPQLTVGLDLSQGYQSKSEYSNAIKNSKYIGPVPPASLGVTEADADHQAALDDTGYWGEAGAGCIIMANDTKRILLPLRSGFVESPDTWGTWGGAIDRGENPKTALIREVGEEAGYEGKILTIEHLYTFTDGDFRYDTFVVVVPKEFEPTLNWETEKTEWVEFGAWPKPLHFGLQAVIDDTTAMNKLGILTSK